MREYRHLRRSSFAAQFFIVRFQGVSGVFALTLCQIEYLLSTFALTLCQIEYLCPLVPSEFSGKSVKIEYLLSTRTIRILGKKCKNRVSVSTRTPRILGKNALLESLFSHLRRSSF